MQIGQLGTVFFTAVVLGLTNFPWLSSATEHSLGQSHGDPGSDIKTNPGEAAIEAATSVTHVPTLYSKGASSSIKGSWHDSEVVYVPDKVKDTPPKIAHHKSSPVNALRVVSDDGHVQASEHKRGKIIPVDKHAPPNIHPVLVHDVIETSPVPVLHVTEDKPTPVVVDHTSTVPCKTDSPLDLQTHVVHQPSPVVHTVVHPIVHSVAHSAIHTVVHPVVHPVAHQSASMVAPGVEATSPTYASEPTKLPLETLSKPVKIPVSKVQYSAAPALQFQNTTAWVHPAQASAAPVLQAQLSAVPPQVDTCNCACRCPTNMFPIAAIPIHSPPASSKCIPASGKPPIHLAGSTATKVAVAAVTTSSWPQAPSSLKKIESLPVISVAGALVTHSLLTASASSAILSIPTSIPSDIPSDIISSIPSSTTTSSSQQLFSFETSSIQSSSLPSPQTEAMSDWNAPRLAESSIASTEPSPTPTPAAAAVAAEEWKPVAGLPTGRYDVKRYDLKPKLVMGLGQA